MAFNLLKTKKHKIGASILAGIIVIVLILSFLINRYWSPILASKIKGAVLSSSDSLYTVDFSDAELHVLRGQLVIHNITLKPDTAVYNRRKKLHLAPNNLVELHVDRLILDHIHPFSLYFHHKLNIDQIIVGQPELKVSYQLNHTKDTVVKDNRTLWQKMSKSLHSIHIGMIFLNDVKLKYEDYSGNKVAISELKEMNLSASDLLIDSATQFDKTRLLYCKEIVTELNNYTGKTPNGLYSYKVKHLKLSTLTSKVNITGLTLSPIKPAAFFSKSKLDRYSLYIDSMQLNNFDYLSYHKYRTFNASSFIIKNGTFSLFSNPNTQTDKNADNIITFPNVALSKYSTELKVDTILIKHINVAYNEFNKKSNQTGTITFNDINGSILNVTNNKGALLKNSISTVKLTTYFMNRGKLNLLFIFNLTDPGYSYKGTLGSMDLSVINQAVMPLSMVKITSGTLKDFNFDVKGDSKIARGRVNLLYNDLKVKLLSKDPVYGLTAKFVASLYANIFIIKHDNPDKPGTPPRTAYVTYSRPKYSPFFTTLWQTLLSGIKPSAGLDAKTEQATIAMQKQQVINQQQRLTKKQLRQQRRAERRQKRALKKEEKAKQQ